jgi:hypothetical protein
MSIDQQGPPPIQPFPVMPVAPPVKAGTSGVTITGFVLAFVLPPIGLILSIIGVVKASGGRRKGKGLAIAGIIIAVVAMGLGGVVVAAVSSSTLADPGCGLGKSAILDNADKISATDQAATKKALQDTVSGLQNAQSQAKHANVRAAMKAAGDDYGQLLAASTARTAPSAALTTKMDKDIDAIDALCTIGS